jgi:hypothetical protein
MHVVVVVVCPCRSNVEHRDLLSEISIVMCVDVVSDEPTAVQVPLNPDVTATAIWQAVRRLG